MSEAKHRITFEGLLWAVFEFCSVSLSVLWTAGFLMASGASMLISALLTIVWEAGKYLLTTEVSRGVAAGPALVVRVAWVGCLIAMAGLCGALVVGSGAYTVGGVLVGAAAEAEALAETAQGQSARIPALEAEALALVADIDRTREEIVEFNRRRWPNNAAAARDRLAAYQERQRQIAVELDQLRGVDRDREIAESGASPRFAVLAAAVGVGAQWLEQAWAIGVGVLIEGLNLVLISRRHLLAGLKRLREGPSLPDMSILETPEGEDSPHSKSEAYTGHRGRIVTRRRDRVEYPPLPYSGGVPEYNSVPVYSASNAGNSGTPADDTPTVPEVRTPAHSVVWSVDVEDRYRALVEAVRAGEINPVTNRAIREQMGVGSEVAGQAQVRLVGEGLIERSGQTYRVRPEVLREALHSVGGGE